MESEISPATHSAEGPSAKDRHNSSRQMPNKMQHRRSANLPRKCRWCLRTLHECLCTSVMQNNNDSIFDLLSSSIWDMREAVGHFLNLELKQAISASVLEILFIFVIVHVVHAQCVFCVFFPDVIPDVTGAMLRPSFREIQAPELFEGPVFQSMSQAASSSVLHNANQKTFRCLGV